jgi:hypothetical protein
MRILVFFSISYWVLGIATTNITEEQHLVACLRTISLKYLTPGSTIALFLSRIEGNSRNATVVLKSVMNDLKNSLTEELHQMALETIVTFGHNYLQTVDSVKEERQEKYQSYIIVAYGEEHQSVVEDIREKLLLLSYSVSWNPRARFVVTAIVTNETYDSRETATHLLEEAFLFKILNVILIIKAPEIQAADQDTEMINNIHVPNFHIFTWFPYESPDRCLSVHDVILLDSWFMEGKGRLNNNIDLFPEKIKYNLRGCLITAATFPVDVVVGPYRYLGHNDSTTSETPYVTYDSGIELHLVKLVTEALNLTLKFLPPPNNNEKWGNVTEEGSITGLLGDVLYERADIGFAAWPLHPRLLTVMDATKSYFRDDWVWWVPCAKKVPRWKSISMVFLPTWMILLVSIIIAAAVIMCLAKRQPTEIKMYRNCVNCIFNVWATVLGVVTPLMPRTLPVRMFFISWIWFCLTINVIFQTFLTTFLIQPGLQQQMDSIEEILASKIKYGYNQGFDMFVQESADELSKIIMKNRVACNEGDEPPCLDWVAYHDNFSLLCSKTLLDFRLASQYFDENGKPLICQAGGLFFPLNYVIYMAKWNPLLNRFNDMLTRLSESGIILKCMEFDLYLKRVHAGIAGRKTLAGEYYDLSLEHSQGIFAVLLPGIALSVVVFFLELFYHKFSRILARKN